MKRFCVFLVAVAIAGLSASPLWAQSGSGTWSTNAAGSWSVVTNWSGSSTYPSGPDNIANFSVLTGNTAVSDDLTTNTIGYLVFGSGAATLSPAVAGNALTLQTTLPGTTPTITVGGSTTTMSLGLAGSQGFILNGGGNLTFATAASLPTGPVVINAGALQFSGTLSTATTFVVNNGATLTLGTDANIGGTNFPSSAIYLSSSGNPTATLNGNGFNNGTTSNQILTTLSGNGNVNCGFTTVSILAANFWQSYGGIMNWGTNTLGIRFNSTTTTMNAQMAEINLGTASGNLSDKSGSTATLFVGALAGGPGTSMASSVTTIEGMANLLNVLVGGHGRSVHQNRHRHVECRAGVGVDDGFRRRKRRHHATQLHERAQRRSGVEYYYDLHRRDALSLGKCLRRQLANDAWHRRKLRRRTDRGQRQRR